MPGNDRLRFHHEQRGTPSRPEPRQHHPIGPIGWAKLNSALAKLSLENQDLVAERKQLSFEVAATAKDVSDSGQ